MKLTLAILIIALFALGNPGYANGLNNEPVSTPPTVTVTPTQSAQADAQASPVVTQQGQNSASTDNTVYVAPAPVGVASPVVEGCAVAGNESVGFLWNLISRSRTTVQVELYCHLLKLEELAMKRGEVKVAEAIRHQLYSSALSQ